MCSLNRFTTEELEKEIENRKKEGRRLTPLPLSERDYSSLFRIVVEHCNVVADRGKEPDQQYVFEAAIEAVYGNGIWKKYNELLK